ncbi:lipopolysaccharide biosynthesis protein [soil metagenome]
MSNFNSIIWFLRISCGAVDIKILAANLSDRVAPRVKFLSRDLINRVGWTTGSYAGVQGLRLVNNVILTRLLAPELFGIMLIVNTLRTGVELLSDIGIGQSIITNANAEDPEFIDTAWSLQALRGASLALVALLLSYPIAHFYRSPILASIIPAVSLFFLFTGLESTSRFVLQKRLELRRLSIFEVVVAVVVLVAHVGFALLTPTIWALVYGGLTSAAAVMIGSYFLIPGMRHRFRINWTYSRQMMAFGKWIFVSSIIYFLAMNFDRLYMAHSVALVTVGIYSIARSLADVLNLLIARIGALVIFPMIAAAEHSRSELRARLLHTRPRVLLGAAVGVSMFISTSDILVKLLYDQRYHAASEMLPVLAAGVWFSILCTINESVLLGIGHPVYSAMANGIKLLWLVIGLPLAVSYYGIAGAVLIIAGSDAVRYVPLWLAQKREHLSFARHDIMITLALIVMVVIWRMLLWYAGIGTGFSGVLWLLKPWFG